MGLILLTMNKRIGPKSLSVPYSRLSQVTVTDYDIHKILPVCININTIIVTSFSLSLSRLESLKSVLAISLFLLTL